MILHAASGDGRPRPRNSKKLNALKQAAIGQILTHREYSTWSGSEPTAHEDRWYHYDMLGNVTALTNANGQVAAQYDMEAFGTVKSGGQNGVHLTTKEWDADSELYYFNARWYDKEAGRWLQQESTGVDGPNLYSFVWNGPVDLIDSTGLFAEPGTLPGWVDDYIYKWHLPGPWGDPDNPGGWGDPLSYDRPKGPGTTAGRICYGVGIGATAGAVACLCTGTGATAVGWKGGEITFTPPGRPTPDFRINPKGNWKNPKNGTERLPHFHRRPGIGKHRPWEGGF